MIANTLSITIAQRTRELATLRTLGATRRQVLRSVMLEALVIGVLASVVGLFLGLGLAKGAERAAGLVRDRPAADRHRVQDADGRSSRWLVGIVITLLAALRPALRATRVPPIAAVREGAVLPPSRFARFGTPPASGTVIVAVALMLVGLLVSGLSTGVRLLALGLGRVVLFVGVAMLAPKLVPPLVRVLGWPATQIGGAAGQLARGNSARNPARTASTASALMIGLALVTLVGVLAAGLRSRFNDAVNQVFVANYAVTATNNFSPISLASENALRKVPGRDRGLRRARRRRRRRSARGSTSPAVEPNVSQVINVDWQDGSPQTPAQLGQRRRVRRQGLRQGAAPARRLAAVGRDADRPVLHLTLRGITAPPKGGCPYGDVTISHAAVRPRLPEPAEPVHVRQHAGRRHGGQHRHARTRR